jgi:chaperonin cofactor prefoldin
LAYTLDMNRAEKEEHVIQLHSEGRSIREIARVVHMSFGGIGAIIKKKTKLVRGQLEEEDDDIKLKSKTTQAYRLFSEGETPVKVAIALDLPADQVRAIYQEYWELVGMGKLAEIYEEVKYDLHDLLRFYRMVKALGMEKQEIISILDLVKNNQLQNLQREAERIRSEINTLETKKTEAMSHYFQLKKKIGEAEKWRI